MKANEFIIAPENAGKSIVEIMQLYSDQKNKEKDSEIQRLTKEVEELRKERDELHRTILFLTERPNELEMRITELTAVCMGHQQRLDAAIRVSERMRIEDTWALREKITRLRELLKKAKGMLLRF